MVEIEHERIRVRTSIPGLEGKVKARIEGPVDVVHWYIRFNLPIDETSVSGKSTNVTDTEGYILRTDISYNERLNCIVVSPLDTYEENRFYLLNIAKAVRSVRGNKLPTSIHILFKLLDNRVSNFRVLEATVKIPPPQPRPPGYELTQKNPINPRPLPIMNPSKRTERLRKMAYPFNPVLALLGLAAILAGVIASQVILSLIGAGLFLAGVAHISYQLYRHRVKLYFNRGVKLFDRERYAQAEIAFKRALTVDPDHELAQYGLYKIGFYE